MNNVDCKIMKYLNENPGACKLDLFRKAGVSYGAAGKSLKRLVAAGYAEKKKNGQKIPYYLTDKGKKLVKLL